MQASSTYWHSLLCHFEKQGYFHNGLTLPFIIGSRSILEPNEPIETIKDFFKHVKLTGTYLNIIKCGGIGEYVFRIGDEEDLKFYDTKGIFIIPDNIFETCSKADEIIDKLAQEYSARIEKGEFSKNGGNWGNYIQKEFEEILEVKG
ncbi:hypothetical protein [Sphingobacterium multivorum]|uniref:hypothetical protein n=1 Tax=Sphingobacterium multivorum TaxID=28454 RepID=UPI002FD9DDD6